MSGICLVTWSALVVLGADGKGQQARTHGDGGEGRVELGDERKQRSRLLFIVSLYSQTHAGAGQPGQLETPFSLEWEILEIGAEVGGREGG